MKNKLKLSLVFFLFIGKSLGQGTIDALLVSIEANNKTLQTVKKAGEAQILQNSTGLTLENPQINYDYMIGRPVGAGNQTDIVVSQGFDFPGVYMKKKELSLEKNKLTDMNYQIVLKQILYDAKFICVDQIYRNKLNHEYELRKKSLEQLISNFQKKMDKGEATIIEVNKVQLQLIELNKEYELNLSMIRQNNSKLTALNGGIVVELNDVEYPVSLVNQTFDGYYAEISDKDPMLKMAEQQNTIAQKQIEMSKSMTFPKFELGYHYQGILGQTFNGAHAAVTIPLWENKNVVKASQANAETIELEKQVYQNDRYFELKGVYEKYQALNKTLIQYQSVFSTFTNTALLEKAYNLGEMNIIEYFQELTFYYENYNDFLETELELNQTMVELLKYDN